MQRRRVPNETTTYVALLRGINVGRKTKVDMKALRAVFEELGCSHVSTYINSGNVIFRDARQPSELVAIGEAAVADRFGFAVRIVVRDLRTIAALCDAIPDDWTNDAAQRTNVLFLTDEMDSPDVLESVVFDAAIENVVHAHGALIWNVSRDNSPRGSALKVRGADAHREMTARNVNTVRKLRALMEAVQ
jgi:uncharacterized protein (DUF1697 family)